jgi:hypothetical protein
MENVVADVPWPIYATIGISFLIALIYSYWEVPSRKLKRWQQQQPSPQPLSKQHPRWEVPPPSPRVSHRANAAERR